MIERVERGGTPLAPLSNAERYANWLALYRIFGNDKVKKEK